MKISKSLLQAIAVAVVIGTTASSCIKDNTEPNGYNKLLKKKIENCDPCPACGMG